MLIILFQVLLGKEDFEEERKDRERMASKELDYKEEINRLEGELRKVKLESEDKKIEKKYKAKIVELKDEMEVRLAKTADQHKAVETGNWMKI